MNVMLGMRTALGAGRMMGYGARGVGFFHPFATLFFLLVFAAIVALVVWLLVRKTRPHAVPAPAAPSTHDAAVAIARERYARGEIDTEQFLSVVTALTAPTATSPATHPEPLPPAAPTAEG